MKDGLPRVWEDHWYLCNCCHNFGLAGCDEYPGMSFEMFRRKYKCKFLNEMDPRWDV